MSCQERVWVWKSSTSRISITQDANFSRRFALSPTAALVQAISFFADPSNLDPIALGNSEVRFPLVTVPGQAYAVIGPGQMGRCYVTNEDEYFDLATFWVTQAHPVNTNIFHYTVWKRTTN